MSERLRYPERYFSGSYEHEYMGQFITESSKTDPLLKEKSILAYQILIDTIGNDGKSHCKLCNNPIEFNYIMGTLNKMSDDEFKKIQENIHELVIPCCKCYDKFVKKQRETQRQPFAIDNNFNGITCEFRASEEIHAGDIVAVNPDNTVQRCQIDDRYVIGIAMRDAAQDNIVAVAMNINGVQHVSVDFGTAPAQHHPEYSIEHCEYHAGINIERYGFQGEWMYRRGQRHSYYDLSILSHHCIDVHNAQEFELWFHDNYQQLLHIEPSGYGYNLKIGTINQLTTNTWRIICRMYV